MSYPAKHGRGERKHHLQAREELSPEQPQAAGSGDLWIFKRKAGKDWNMRTLIFEMLSSLVRKYDKIIKKSLFWNEASFGPSGLLKRSYQEPGSLWRTDSHFSQFYKRRCPGSKLLQAVCLAGVCILGPGLCFPSMSLLEKDRRFFGVCPHDLTTCRRWSSQSHPLKAPVSVWILESHALRP